MREIKFRAWIPTEKRIAAVTDIDFEIGIVAVEEVGLDQYNFLANSNVVLEQYTGLKDIYEGDFLDDDGDYWLVKFYDGAFVGELGNTLESLENLEDLEVIGNIHQNPELLEG